MQVIFVRYVLLKIKVYLFYDDTIFGKIKGALLAIFGM